MRQRAIAVAVVAWGQLAAAAPAAPAAPVKAGAIGTAHPIVIEEHGRDGGWVVACQARKDTDHRDGISIEYSLHGMSGDRLEPYLIWGSGAGERIDAYANQSPDGRWLAVVRDGQLVLYDTTTRKRVVLAGANIEDDGSSDPSHRATSFAAAGNRMVYFRAVNGRDVVVVRELATGAERIVDVPGVVWRADVDAAGRWAKLRVVRSDANHDGKLDWPLRLSWLGLHACFQGDPHGALALQFHQDDHGAPTQDEPVEVWLDLVTGRMVDDPTVLSALGDGLLRAAPDQAITLDGAPLVPAACHGKLIAVAASPPRVVVACGAPKAKHGTVGVFGPGLAVTTAQETGYEDRTYRSGPMVATTAHACPHYEGWCVELATGAITPLPGKSPDVWSDQIGELVFVLEAAEPKLGPTGQPILDENKELIYEHASYVWDAAAGKKRPFPDLKDRFPDVEGPLVTLAQQRFDWVHNRRIGGEDERIYATDDAGRVLVGPPQPGPNRISLGPLRWELRGR